MTKSQKDRTAPTRSGSVREEESIIPVKYQHVAAIAVLFLSLVIFFNQIILGGKTFLGSDTIASHSWDTVLKEADAEGIFPLWNPYIFCGFPGYASLTYSGSRGFDISSRILAYADAALHYVFLAPAEGWVLGYYLIFATGMYILIFTKVRKKLPALIGALGATYSMYIIIWIMAGHNTKISVMAFFPFIFLVVEHMREKFDWKIAFLLVFLLHFSFLPAQVQMNLYTFLAIGVYLLFFFLRALIKKEEWKGTVRAGAVFAVAAVLAFAMDADKYLSVWEYTPYSMRGSNPAVETVNAGKTVQGGLGYDYATAWSFGVGEVATFVIPWWYGFGQSLTHDLPLQGYKRLPFYIGPQPFTDAPQYMGVVILALAIFGFVRNRKNPFVQYLGLMVLFSMLIAFGKEFSPVYDLMYNYFPMFSKFRVPSMILVLVQIFVPILAAYGIASLIQSRSQSIVPAADKRLKYALGALAILFLLAILAPPVFKGIYSSFIPLQEAGKRLSVSYGNNPQLIALVYDFISQKVATDFIFVFAFLLITVAAYYRYVHQRMGAQAFAIIVAVVVVADLWRVAYQPMDPRDRIEQKAIFTAPDYVRYLQQDTSLFRVLLFENGEPVYNNTLAYWKIQYAYGYQGAKMRWYQDIVDDAGIGNPLVWQLMNVKYIISNTPDSNQVLGLVFNGPQYKIYANRAYLPRAFFVKRYEVASGIDILRKMQTVSFDVRDVAYMTENADVNIEPPNNGAGAEYVHYGLQDLEMKVTATGNNLLFLSESYYPKGWKAYLDGNEIPIYRLDYLFRGVVIPVGTHKLQMKFHPTGFYLGRDLSLGMNVLLLGVMLFSGVDFWRKRKVKPIVPQT